MVAIQIRDVPDDIGDRLRAAALARGQSLQAYLLALVTDEARRADNLAVLGRMADRNDGSQLSAAEVVEDIRRMRGERDEHVQRVLGDAAGPSS